LSVDDLRAMTPAGSLRALSFEAASALLDSLNQNRPEGAERPAGERRSGRRGRPGIYKMVTPRQIEAVGQYRAALGWTEARLDEFLRRTIGMPLAKVAVRRDASRAIFVLQRCLQHALRKRQQSQGAINAIA